MAVALSETRQRNEFFLNRAVADVVRGPETGMSPARKGSTMEKEERSSPCFFLWSLQRYNGQAEVQPAAMASSPGSRDLRVTRATLIIQDVVGPPFISRTLSSRISTRHHFRYDNRSFKSTP